MIKFILRLAFACFAFWMFGLAFYVAWIYSAKPYDGRAEGIVVFTGGGERVRTGLQLLEQGRGDYLLVSGVHSQVKKAEIIALAYPGQKPDEKLLKKIDLGFAAQDTSGNADEAAAWVTKRRIQSLIVVTSHYHMPRALIHLGSELPDVALYPYPVRAMSFMYAESLFNIATWRPMIRDYNKLLLTYPQILLKRFP